MTLLDDLKELEAKATPGEWRQRSWDSPVLVVHHPTTNRFGEKQVTPYEVVYAKGAPGGVEQRVVNARLAGAAVNLVRQSLRGEGDFIILPRVPSEEEVERCARITFAETQAVVRAFDFPSWEDDEETTRELARRITRAAIAAYTGAHHE